MLPWCKKQTGIKHGKHSLVLEAKEVYYALRNTFSEKDDTLGIEVARFERNFDNENLFNLGTLSNSREGARSNPINEVKMRHIPIETFTLRWFPVEPLIKLYLR